ncbi:uncharacterized protein LOC141535709 [Cotesia typhae]|uniref:uncharacterized protein LOC141535709 n=1 Tax=Cotesia typhae TaxID=2053667 RepID=UPI003D69DA08
MLEQYEWFPERVEPEMGARTSVTYVSASGDNPTQLYVCSACGKRYKWLDSLRRHQRVECGNKEKRFSCNACSKKFRYRYELRNHISAYH